MKYAMRRSRPSEMLFGVSLLVLGNGLSGTVHVGLGSAICVQGPRGREVAELHLSLSVLLGTELEVRTWSLQTVLASKLPVVGTYL